MNFRIPLYSRILDSFTVHQNAIFLIRRLQIPAHLQSIRAFKYFFNTWDGNGIGLTCLF